MTSGAAQETARQTLCGQAAPPGVPAITPLSTSLLASCLTPLLGERAPQHLPQESRATAARKQLKPRASASGYVPIDLKDLAPSCHLPTLYYRTVTMTDT